MRFYGKYIKPYRIFFIFGPILMLSEVIGEVLMPKMMANIINNGIPNGDTSYIISMGLAMAGIALIMMIGGVGGNYFACRATIGFSSDLRSDLYRKVQSYSFANVDHFQTGSLVTRLTNDVTQLQNFTRMCMIMMLRAPGMMIGAIIMALRINARLSLIIAAMVPILGGTIYYITSHAFPRFIAMQGKIDALNTGVQENLTNVRVIKSFVREDYERERFEQKTTDLRDHTLKALRLIIFTFPVMTLAMNITTLAVVWFGGKQVIVGSMQVGDLTAFTTYVVQILMSLMMLSMIVMQFSRASASSHRIKEVMEEKLDLTDENAACKDLEVARGEVEFRDVCFRYYKDHQEWVLDHISFDAKPGQVLGIIGSTGSGKTTMVQLIPRLYDVDEGQVLVDGVDVRDYSLENLREGVGMVLQNNLLFSGTIKDNLLWGDGTATEEELAAAADAAQAQEFIKGFKAGYDTELGQGGTNVSGGQKQRLCIARALLKHPKILILDDSTSAVDTATEARIREAFRTTLKDTTKIIIAQRISSVRDADQILVIDEGRIVGRGAHEDLLASNKEYQEIYYSQQDRNKEAGD
ncbi:MAG: ABC transporter ATP-binding protein [Firmicutes bacterium]|nr:ABC transporter ATP-binding protein [Bacillota bacterium]